MLRNVFVMIFAILFAIAMIGCEGEEGPAGPQGPQGEQGEQGPAGDDGEDGEDAPTPEPYTYLGNDGENCAHCHGSTVAAWEATGHPNAYANLAAEDQEDPYCLKCHVTGVEVEVIENTGFGSTEFAAGTDDYGYDNYFGVDTPEAEARRMALEGVQCEACHGPVGPVTDVGPHQPVAIGLSTLWEEVGAGEYEFDSACYPCHESILEEWVESGHAQSEGGDPEALTDHFGRSSCAPCHTNEGFLAANETAYADYSGMYSQIGCVACHDPHDASNPGQLRNTDAVYVEYHPGYDPEEDGVMGTMSGYGAGQTCAQCHHARRDTDNVLNQIENGYAHFGPHGSPQMDMFVGYGCYEIDGFDYDDDRSNVHQNAVDDACVSCHMVREDEQHGQVGLHVRHQFAPQGAACAPCHDFAPDDFDYQSVQTNTMAKMDELAQALGYADFAAFNDHDNGFDSQADGVTNDERMAAYALVFVGNDGSYGVHNPDYSMALLQNAIDHLNTLP